MGSRNYQSPSLVRHFIRCLPKGIGIVSGGCVNSPDQWAAWEARRKGIPVLEFLPDWNKHGKSAGFIRNVDIVSSSDLVVAFWDELSYGTRHSMAITRKQGKPLLIIYEDGYGFMEAVEKVKELAND